MDEYTLCELSFEGISSKLSCYSHLKWYNLATVFFSAVLVEGTLWIFTVQGCLVLQSTYKAVPRGCPNICATVL